MEQPGERPLPDGLDAIAARLRAERAQGDPLQLDQIKQRVMARGARRERRSTFMKSRLATVATLAALIGGTGGAIAVGSSGSTNGNGFGLSAAGGQYTEGKGCKNHHKKSSRCKKHHQKRTKGKRKTHGPKPKHKHKVKHRSPRTAG